MRAYVQQLLEDDASYLSFNQIAHWFRERGYEVVRFDYPQLDEGFLDRGLLKYPYETIVAGGVKTIREALIRAGRPVPNVPDLPECLKPWIARRFWTATFGEIRLLADEGRRTFHSTSNHSSVNQFQNPRGKLG